MQPAVTSVTTASVSGVRSVASTGLTGWPPIMPGSIGYGTLARRTLSGVHADSRNTVMMSYIPRGRERQQVHERGVDRLPCRGGALLTTFLHSGRRVEVDQIHTLSRRVELQPIQVRWSARCRRSEDRI